MNMSFVLFDSIFVAKLLISGILFSIAVNAVFVVKLLISGILFSTAVNAVLLLNY